MQLAIKIQHIAAIKGLVHIWNFITLIIQLNALDIIKRIKMVKNKIKSKINNIKFKQINESKEKNDEK